MLNSRYEFDLKRGEPQVGLIVVLRKWVSAILNVAVHRGERFAGRRHERSYSGETLRIL